MYKGLDIKTRMGLLLAGKKAGLSYHETIDDYDKSYKKYQDGGETGEDPILNNIYKQYPAFKNMGEVTLKPDTNYTREKTGVGDIEYFAPTQTDSMTYNTGYKYAAPKPGTHGIVYNPNNNNQQSIMLDMLHGMKSDPVYNKHREEFSSAFLKSQYGEDLKRDWDREYGNNGNYTQLLGEGEDKLSKSEQEKSAKKHYKDNWIDGNIRSLMFEGSDKDFEKARYWKDAKKEYLSDPDINKRFGQLKNYLSTGQGYMLPETEITSHKYGVAIKKYQDGGEVKPSMQLPIVNNNPSENVNQQIVIDPYLRAQQINKSNRKPTQEVISNTNAIEQQKKKDRQDYIDNYVTEGHKKAVEFAPFKAAAYLTPAGMAIGAMQGVANLVPDLYNKEYLSAANDVLMMAPTFAGNIKNAYRLNPKRFKADPDAYYHRSQDLDQVLINDKLVGYGTTVGGKKITEEAIKKYGKGIVNLKKAANDEPYFSKGVPLDWGRYNPAKNNWAGKNGEIAQGYPGPYLAEAKNVDFVAKADNRLQKVWSKDGTTWERGIAPNEIGAYATPVQGYVPKENLNFYKEHWWKGYKKINK